MISLQSLTIYRKQFNCRTQQLGYSRLFNLINNHLTKVVHSDKIRTKDLSVSSLNASSYRSTTSNFDHCAPLITLTGQDLIDSGNSKIYFYQQSFFWFESTYIGNVGQPSIPGTLSNTSSHCTLFYQSDPEIQGYVDT